MAHTETQTEWEETMARRVMEQIRSELYLDQRYLNAALGALPPAPLRSTQKALATDGAHLYYPPEWVLQLYRKNRRYLPRAYLHSLFHCILRHLWLRDRRDPALWGLACDITVEHLLDSLGTPATTRPVGWLRQQTYARLKAECKLLAAGLVYRVLAATDAATLQKYRQEFISDDHRLWPADPDSASARMRGKQWEQMGRQTELSMEESGRQAGETDGARALQAQVQASRSRRSYKDFLRRFAVWREEPHLDPDEFDLGYYTYGLRTYGKMPLIEPLESRESKKIRDFVIVLDTSESTAGELVKNFLRETFTLLKSQDSFFRQCRILVMQADNAVAGGNLAVRPGSPGPLHPGLHAGGRWRHRLPPRFCPHRSSCGPKGPCGRCRGCSTSPTARAPTPPSGPPLRWPSCFWKTANPRRRCRPGPCGWCCSPREFLQQPKG